MIQVDAVGFSRVAQLVVHHDGGRVEKIYDPRSGAEVTETAVTFVADDATIYMYVGASWIIAVIAHETLLGLRTSGWQRAADDALSICGLLPSVDMKVVRFLPSCIIIYHCSTSPCVHTAVLIH